MVINCQKKYQNNPKISKMPFKWPKIVLNILANGHKWARNTDTKLPDLKLWKITKKWGEFGKLDKMAMKTAQNAPNGENMKNAQKCPKIAQKFFPPNIWIFKQFLFCAPTKNSLSKWAKLIGHFKKLANFQFSFLFFPNTIFFSMTIKYFWPKVAHTADGGFGTLLGKSSSWIGGGKHLKCASITNQQSKSAISLLLFCLVIVLKKHF